MVIFGFFSYLLTFSQFENSEINNRFEYIGEGDDIEVGTLVGGSTVPP